MKSGSLHLRDVINSPPPWNTSLASSSDPHSLSQSHSQHNFHSPQPSQLRECSQTSSQVTAGGQNSQQSNSSFAQGWHATRPRPPAHQSSASRQPFDGVIEDHRTVTKRHFDSTEEKSSARFAKHHEMTAQSIKATANSFSQQKDALAEIKNAQERHSAALERICALVERLTHKVNTLETLIRLHNRHKTSSPMRAIDLDEDVFSSDHCGSDGKAELDACTEAEVDALDLFRSSVECIRNKRRRE